MLNKLPSPPPDKSGWPWTVESVPLPPFQPDGNVWPRLSIVTPSYNQSHFIEETIRSILLQNYPNLEYLIIDGGSTDRSSEIIKKYEQWLTYWVSENDSGQSHAINKGFEKCSGELVNWICSDDLLCPNALNDFIKKTDIKPDTLYLGDWTLINESGHTIKKGRNSVYSFEMLVDISNFWRNGASISQQSALYPLQTIRKINGLNTTNHYSMDYELWGRLLLADCEIQNVSVTIGAFRVYDEQKTAMRFPVTLSLVISSLNLLYKSDLRYVTKFMIGIRNIKYLLWFIYHHLRSILGIRRRFQEVWRKIDR